MERFKKRTVALVLASVITVVGAFGAENYKNSLMSLNFSGGSDGGVNMTLYTKTKYEGTINPMRRDANTFVIMLPETTSEPNINPEIKSDGIASVSVNTMPYTTSNKGYTKITVKTNQDINLIPQNALYIEKKKDTSFSDTEEEKSENNTVQEQTLPTLTPNYEKRQKQREETKKNNNNSYKTQQTKYEPPKQETVKAEPVKQEPEEEYVNYSAAESSPMEKMWILVGFILITILIVFVIIQSKERMVAVIGEQGDFSIDDDKEEKKKKPQKPQKTYTAINKPERKNIPPMSKVNIITGATISDTPESELPQETETKPIEDNVVDLDSLLKEKQVAESTNETENPENDYDDLADFLNEFTFDEEAPNEPENLFDEEFFNKCINDGKLVFSPEDIKKISALMQVEISEDTMNNLSDFIKPESEKPQSKLEKLENILASYSINQDIEFSKDDVDAISKLLDVELDNDFITDLRTNPERVKTMLKEMEQKEAKPHKASEILTLSVKDMLPDLSKELKKQGHKKIESNAKPEVVYFSEGYEVSKLNVGNELSDISSALKDKKASEYRPSDLMDIVEPGYDVATLSIKDDLPDLTDIKHTNQYEEKKERISAKDAKKTLLENLANVTFKPFYEDENAPSITEVKEEFNQFGNFEVLNNEQEEFIPEEKPSQNDENDFAELFKEEPVQEPEKPDIAPEPNETKEVLTDVPEIKVDIPQGLPVLEKVRQPIAVERSNREAETLLKLIEEQQHERENKKQESVIQKREPIQQKQEKTLRSRLKQEPHEVPKTVTYEDVEYDVVAAAAFNMISGCYLCKTPDKYLLLGYFNDEIIKLKEYKELRTETLQQRVSDKNRDGSVNYIVRVSIHKFVVKLSKDKMEFLLDLC